MRPVALLPAGMLAVHACASRSVIEHALTMMSVGTDHSHKEWLDSLGGHTRQALYRTHINSQSSAESHCQWKVTEEYPAGSSCSPQIHDQWLDLVDIAAHALV